MSILDLQISNFLAFCDIIKHLKIKYLNIFEQKYLGIWLPNMP